MPSNNISKAVKTQKKEKNIKNIKNIKENIKKTKKKVEKKEDSVLLNAMNLHKNVKLATEDKLLKKVEKYVEDNREKTSQEMRERKEKRPSNNYKEWDLDVLISRLSIESKPKNNVKEASRWLLYIIYVIIIILILIFIVKFFFVWNMSQNP